MLVLVGGKLSERTRRNFTMDDNLFTILKLVEDLLQGKITTVEAICKNKIEKPPRCAKSHNFSFKKEITLVSYMPKKNKIVPHLSAMIQYQKLLPFIIALSLKLTQWTSFVQHWQRVAGSPDREILWAAETGNLSVVERLLETDLQLLHVRDKDGYTPLHRACYNDHIEVVNYLLLKGANLRAQTEDGWQPFHSSCMWNNYRCVAKLLDHGTDINATSKGVKKLAHVPGQTPLHLAASNSQAKETLQLLLMHPHIKADIRNASNETAGNIALRSSKHFRLFEM
ncbi:hypothetical protein PR048_016954, partial [Dryococelus australis]